MTNSFVVGGVPVYGFHLFPGPIRELQDLPIPEFAVPNNGITLGIKSGTGLYV